MNEESLELPDNLLIRELKANGFDKEEIVIIWQLVDVICNECWDNEYPCTCLFDD